MNNFYTQDISGCLAAQIGDRGLGDGAYAGLLPRTGVALAELRAAHADGSMPLLLLPEARADIDGFRDFAMRFRESYSDVVVLGTGGSSLAGRTLYAMADRGFGPPPGNPRLHFMDNVDPDTFAALLDALDLGATGVIAISKSGSTAETLTQLSVVVDAMRAGMDAAAVGGRIAVIAAPGEHVLGAVAERFGMVRFDHDPNVSGRFSVLSVVGLLPALIAGLDVSAVREGAATVLAPVLAGAPPADVAAATGAAVSVGLARETGVATSVLMPYSDRLAAFGLWYRQLWAESLGKGGQGTTPVRAMGTVDQHSQLQLYLDGPADKMFSLILPDSAGSGAKVPDDFAAMDGLSYLRGRTMGDLIEAEGRATAETLISGGCPTRVFRLPLLDEAAMGALLMHFMLETVISAHLFGVDPFDQPAVEHGKKLTRDYLAGTAG